MEDALALLSKTSLKHLMKVLILVLMEDALAHVSAEDYEIIEQRLNPCFNGRCTRTVSLLKDSDILYTS